MRRAALLRQFGARVRALREGENLSQERLGELAGLHRNYIGAVERGEYNPTLVSMARIAKALGVTLAELLKGIRG
jgi:transcriptional regulator with XRE-family HTH domain